MRKFQCFLFVLKRSYIFLFDHTYHLHGCTFNSSVLKVLHHQSYIRKVVQSIALAELLESSKNSGIKGSDIL